MTTIPYNANGCNSQDFRPFSVAHPYGGKPLNGEFLRVMFGDACMTVEYILDIFLGTSDTNALKTALALWRITHGWQKTTVTIGVRLLAKVAGLCIPSVLAGIQTLQKMAMIIVHSPGHGGRNTYTLPIRSRRTPLDPASHPPPPESANYAARCSPVLSPVEQKCSTGLNTKESIENKASKQQLAAAAPPASVIIPHDTVVTPVSAPPVIPPTAIEPVASTAPPVEAPIIANRQDKPSSQMAPAFLPVPQPKATSELDLTPIERAILHTTEEGLCNGLSPSELRVRARNTFNCGKKLVPDTTPSEVEWFIAEQFKIKGRYNPWRAPGVFYCSGGVLFTGADRKHPMSLTEWVPLFRSRPRPVAPVAVPKLPAEAPPQSANTTQEAAPIEQAADTAAPLAQPFGEFRGKPVYSLEEYLAAEKEYDDFLQQNPEKCEKCHGAGEVVITDQRYDPRFGRHVPFTKTVWCSCPKAAEVRVERHEACFGKAVN